MVKLFNRRKSDQRKPYNTPHSRPQSSGDRAISHSPISKTALSDNQPHETMSPASPSEPQNPEALEFFDFTIPVYDDTSPAALQSARAAQTSSEAGCEFSAATQNPNASPNHNTTIATSVAPAQTTAQSKIFTFMGASGGVGTTSLAVQTAYELALSRRNKGVYARRNQAPDVCLIDLDFESGSCAYHMDLQPRVTLDDLSGSAARIDETFTAAMLSPHQCGVTLLAAINTHGANQRINPQSVMALLDAASTLYPYVIIDMPRYMQNWSEAVMGGSDFVGVVSELTISSLHMSRDILNRADETLGMPLKCHPILNKYERRSFNNTLRLKDAESVLHREVLGTICVDNDATREAINCGEPVGAIRPDNRYVKDTRKLLEKINQTCVIAAQSLATETVHQAEIDLDNIQAA